MDVTSRSFNTCEGALYIIYLELEITFLEATLQ